MAVDFHYSTGNPGLIAPLADVAQVAGYVVSLRKSREMALAFTGS
jgi:hypothetical protein